MNTINSADTYDTSQIAKSHSQYTARSNEHTRKLLFWCKLPSLPWYPGIGYLTFHYNTYLPACLPAIPST